MSYIQQDLTPQARGDTWNLEFLMQDSTGAIIDITGNQYWFTLKSSVDLTDPGAELQYGPIAVSGVNAPLGKVVMSIPSGMTDSLAPATYNYDLQEVSSTGVISTLLIGKVRVKADVTRTANYAGSSSIVSSVAGKILYSGETTSTSSTEIFQDGIFNSRYSIVDEGVLSFDALIIGRDNTTGQSCAFQLYGALKKDLTTTQIIGSVGKTILGKDNAAFDVSITADDVNDSLKLEVTAATTNTTKWAAEVQYTEVNF